MFTPHIKQKIEEYGIKFECAGNQTSEVINNFYSTEPDCRDYDEFTEEAKLKLKSIYRG